MKVVWFGLYCLLDTSGIEFDVAVSICSVCASLSKRLEDGNGFLFLFIVILELGSEELKWFVLPDFSV